MDEVKQMYLRVCKCYAEYVENKITAADKESSVDQSLTDAARLVNTMAVTLARWEALEKLQQSS